MMGSLFDSTELKRREVMGIGLMLSCMVPCSFTHVHSTNSVSYVLGLIPAELPVHAA